MLSEISQRKTKTVWSHLYVEYKKAKLIETESRMVVAKDRGCGKWGDVGQKMQTSSYKLNKFWGCNVQHVTIVNNTILYI